MKLKPLLGLIIIIMVVMSCSSCKKEAEVIPLTLSSVTHYQLSSSRQYDEAEEIWVYADSTGSVTISVPIQSAYSDTLPTVFDQQVNVLPLKITGNISISGSSMTLNYHEMNVINTTQQHDVVNAMYIEI